MVDAVQEKYVVESALFSAGKPLSPEEIAEATELPLASVKKMIKELAKDYSEREGSIEISQVGIKYAMQLKSSYAVHASKLAQMEIPLHVLKTVALIAYHQPVTQSNLKRLLGAKVYEHVDVLDQLGLIRARKIGQTKILTTTPRFCEYFGISEVSKDGVKSWLAKKVGVKTGSGTIEEFLDKLDVHGEGGQAVAPMSLATSGAAGVPAGDAETAAALDKTERGEENERSKEAPELPSEASGRSEEAVDVKASAPPADEARAPEEAGPEQKTRADSEAEPVKPKGKPRSKKGKKN